MDQDNNVPLLLSFYFGASAPSAQRGASARLKKWCRAFDQWIAERKVNNHKDTLRQIKLAWRRLVDRCGKMPWQVTEADIEQLTAWMKEQDFTPITIDGTLGYISGFYRWCDEKHVDKACASGFNPAKDAPRVKVTCFDGVSMWSLEEVQAFLGLLARDSSEIGKREYAFFLARLNLGVVLDKLLRLEWGQIEQHEGAAWVKWRVDGVRVSLPDQVWHAIEDYLRVSGRLEGMTAGKYIFTPQAIPGKHVTNWSADDWLEQQHLSTSTILAILKTYGRKVGIAEFKLTLAALRRTAIRLKLDQGESLEGMQAFMDCRRRITHTKYLLGMFPQLAEESSINPQTEAELPLRKGRYFEEGDHSTHGIYKRKQDEQALAAILAEDIHGLDEEIACLQQLIQGLLEHEGDQASVMDAYSQAALRLDTLTSASQPAEKNEQDLWAEEFLRVMDEFQVSRGEPPTSQETRRKALESSPGMQGAKSRLIEQIGTIRLMLRNVYRRAMQGVEPREYLRLVDLYGRGCMRLSRLIKVSGSAESGRLGRYIRNQIDEAIRQITIEKGLDR